MQGGHPMDGTDSENQVKMDVEILAILPPDVKDLQV